MLVVGIEENRIAYVQNNFVTINNNHHASGKHVIEFLTGMAVKFHWRPRLNSHNKRFGFLVHKIRCEAFIFVLF